jgi:sulfur carrier protein ThiS
MILSSSFKDVCNIIGETYQRRWQILSEFARSTTKRLQMIRKDLSLPGLRKAQVTAEQLQKFIAQKPDAAKEFAQFLANLLKNIGVNESSIVSVSYGLEPGKISLTKLILDEVATAYSSSIPDLKVPESYILGVKEIKNVQSSIVDIKSCINKVTELGARVKDKAEAACTFGGRKTQRTKLSELYDLYKDLDNSIKILESKPREIILSINQAIYRKDNYSDNIITLSRVAIMKSIKRVLDIYSFVDVGQVTKTREEMNECRSLIEKIKEFKI